MGIRHSLLLILAFTVIPAEDLTLKEAEVCALENGHTAKKNSMKEKTAEWEKRNAIAGYLPKVDYSLTYIMYDDSTVELSNFGGGGSREEPPDQAYDTTGTGFTTSQLRTIDERIGYALSSFSDIMSNTPSAIQKHNLDHKIEISQPIINSGKEIIALKIARASKKAAEYSIEADKINTLYKVREGYFNAITARENRRIAEKRLNWATRNLRKAEKRHESGGISRIDLLQWQNDSLKAANEVEKAYSNEKSAISNLYLLMGKPTDISPSEISLLPLEHFEREFLKGPERFREDIVENKEYASLLSRKDLLELDRSMKKANFTPSLNAFFNYSWESRVEEGFEFFKYRSWSLGAILKVPLFSGFRNTTSLKKSRSEYKEMEYQVQEFESSLNMQKRTTKRRYRTSRNSVESMKKQLGIMEKTVEISQVRYDNGQISFLTLREIVLDHDELVLGYINELFNSLLVEAELKKINGTLEVTK